MPRTIPDILKDHILPFDWDVRKVWALDAPAVPVSCAEFAYLLELPLWSSVAKRGMLFDIRPLDVIRDPGVSDYQARRLREADLHHPIDVLLLAERRWILDGVHRIARHVALGSPTLFARFHDASVIPAIRRHADA
ncbi:MAG: hypothetical protein H3C26_14640 [Rhodocyclaceae bacterium]|nr:hypothetical protein [Rhodocyclaceae bacterium]